MRSVSRSTLIVGIAALFGLASCASVDVPDDIAGPTTTELDTSASDPPENCIESERPSSATGGHVAEIRSRGRLIVGVDVGTVGLSSVDPETREFEGFDVDVAKEVAAALFGNPEAVTFIGIPSSEREAVLQDGTVDLVADAFTMTCGRTENINFSTSYFKAYQKVLMREDKVVSELAELAGQRVCMSAGSTAIANLNEAVSGAEIVTRPERGDCLVALQQGEVAAMATDDAILAGFAKQDPNLELVGEPFSEEPYGLGLPKDSPEWTSYVNGVLEDVISSGRWNELYNTHFGDVAGLQLDAARPDVVYKG